MKKALGVLFVLSMVGMLVMGTVSLAIADVGQTWYFQNNSADSESFAVDGDACLKYNKYMSMNDPCGSEANVRLGYWGNLFTCGLDDNDDAWFYANYAASIDASLSNQGWSSRIVYSSSYEPDCDLFDIHDYTIGTLTVKVLKIDENGAYTVIAQQTQDIPAGKRNAVLEFNDISASTPGLVKFSSEDGDRLAVRLFAQIEGEGSLDRDWMTVSINGCNGSSVTSPSTLATVPTPELPTIALMSIGFLGLGGYVWLRHRRNAAAVS